jgi:phage major head subunit gpT-like protein
VAQLGRGNAIAKRTPDIKRLSALLPKALSVNSKEMVQNTHNVRPSSTQSNIGTAWALLLARVVRDLLHQERRSNGGFKLNVTSTSESVAMFHEYMMSIDTDHLK